MFTEAILMGVFDQPTEAEKLRRIVQVEAEAMGGAYHSADVLIPTANPKLVRQQSFLYLFRDYIPDSLPTISDQISPLGRSFSEALNEINRYFIKEFDHQECFGKFIYWLPTGKLGAYYKGKITVRGDSLCPIQSLPYYSYRAQVAIGGVVNTTLYIGIAKIEELKYQLAVGIFLAADRPLLLETRLYTPERIRPYTASVGQYQNCPDYAVIEEFIVPGHWYRHGSCIVELHLPNSPIHSLELFV